MKHEELIERLRSTDPEAADALASLHAQAEAMAEALAPFSKASEIKLCGGDYWTSEKTIQGTDIAFYVKFGDLRDARQSLAAWAEYKESAK